MNATECAIVQRLIDDLDNTRLIYTCLKPLLIRPHLKFLVERMANSHATIADELAAQMDRTGGLTARRGASTPARLRARIERWMAIGNLDIEIGCLKRIAQHEAGVTQRFDATLDGVKGLHENLHRERNELERIRFRIESLMHEMDMPMRETDESSRDEEMPSLPSPRHAAARRTATVTTLAGHHRTRS